jgi:hypothetical protein
MSIICILDFYVGELSDFLIPTLAKKGISISPVWVVPPTLALCWGQPIYHYLRQKQIHNQFGNGSKERLEE